MRRALWPALGILSRQRLALVLLVPLALAGCKRAAPGPVIPQESLQLTLPESPGGTARLEIDGHEVALPAGGAPLRIARPEGTSRVLVAYTFWPDAHTTITRRKAVGLSGGQTIAVNLLKEDEDTPDRLFPESVPTPAEVVVAMGQLAEVAKDDIVFDIGGGDGKVAVAAVAQLGARKAVALDYDADRTKKARENVRAAGVGNKVQVIEENVLVRKDFSEADVIILSWTSPANETLLPALRTGLRHGTRIVSCRSSLGDWRPDETRAFKVKDTGGREVTYPLYLWKIRAPQVPNLYLELPESEEAPYYAPERVSKLTIDGKDFSKPHVTHRAVAVTPQKGAAGVKVVYTFWPNTYTEITRTRTVKLGPGPLTRASLMNAAPAAPDQIRPIYVPTPEEVVDEMCRMAKVTKDDVVYDIGCGDGRLVIRSAKQFGAKKGVGIDINPDLVKLCEKNAKDAGVSDKVKFEAKDAQKIDDFSEATVVFLYLGDFLNEALRPALQKTLKPGTRVVSHRFLMGDWKPDRTEVIKAKDNDGQTEEFKLHLWTIK